MKPVSRDYVIGDRVWRLPRPGKNEKTRDGVVIGVNAASTLFTVLWDDGTEGKAWGYVLFRRK